MKKHKRIIIWGAKSDTGHTHSFTHNGFYRAAKYLGVDVFWLDNRDQVAPDLFDDALIITEHFIATTIPISNDLPLRKTSTYIVNYLGNVTNNRTHYADRVGRIIDLRFSNNWNDSNWKYDFQPWKYQRIPDSVSFFEGDKNENLYMTWATDLLPTEIDFDARFTPFKEPNYAIFCGTIREDNKSVFEPFIRACNDSNVPFMYNNPWHRQMSSEEMRKWIIESFLPLEVRSQFHLDNGYIPCRSIKNVSYGALGLTNSRAVYEFFEREIAYSPDSYELFHIAKSMQTDTKTKNLILNQMKRVKEKHTYVNRVKDMIYVSDNL